MHAQIIKKSRLSFSFEPQSKKLFAYSLRQTGPPLFIFHYYNLNLKALLTLLLLILRSDLSLKFSDQVPSERWSTLNNQLSITGLSHIICTHGPPSFQYSTLVVQRILPFGCNTGVILLLGCNLGKLVSGQVLGIQNDVKDFFAFPHRKLNS